MVTTRSVKIIIYILVLIKHFSVLILGNKGDFEIADERVRSAPCFSG